MIAEGVSKPTADRSCRKKPKTLSGIETKDLTVQIGSRFRRKKPKTLSGIETIERAGAANFDGMPEKT